MDKYVKNRGLFGDDKEFKSLGYIHDHFDDFQPQVRRRITNIVKGFDISIKALADISNLSVQAHYLGVLRSETEKRLQSLRIKHPIDSTYVDYLLNFINAKSKNRIKAVRMGVSLMKKLEKNK